MSFFSCFSNIILFDIFCAHCSYNLFITLGVQQWSDGSSYEGVFNNDQRHGQGTQKWIDGSVSFTNSLHLPNLCRNLLRAMMPSYHHLCSL